VIALDRLERLLAGFGDLRIGLIGDLFLDRYLEIDAELRELSIETGLEAYQVTRIRNQPGALGTVMNNLVALGVGRLVPVTVLGDDGQAYDLLQALEQMPVDAAHVVRDPHRKTPTYTKPLQKDAAGAWRELNRLDLRNREPLSAASERQVIERATAVWESTDGLIVLDQVNESGWGVVTPRVREHLAELQRGQPNKLMFIDSRAFIGEFRAGTLKPNIAECCRALGRPIDEREFHQRGASSRLQVAQAAATELSRRAGQRIYCTAGSLGILVVDAAGAELSAAPPVSGPIDTVGAGDSATSGIVAALLCGATPGEAADVGNLVASITVTQLGTTGTANPEQLRQRRQQLANAVGAT